MRTAALVEHGRAVHRRRLGSPASAAALRFVLGSAHGSTLVVGVSQRALLLLSEAERRRGRRLRGGRSRGLGSRRRCDGGWWSRCQGRSLDRVARSCRAADDRTECRHVETREREATAAEHGDRHHGDESTTLLRAEAGRIHVPLVAEIECNRCGAEGTEPPGVGYALLLTSLEGGGA